MNEADLHLNRRFKYTTYFGLTLVLVGTSLFWHPAFYKSLFSENFILRNYLMQGVDWLVVGIILLLIYWGERNQFSSLNFKPITAETFSLGMALGGLSMIYIVLHRLGMNFLGWQPVFEQQANNATLDSIGPS
ncbi:MAG: hypothetical protein AAFU03_01780, partial [Bacteroidota bacterium]